MIILFLFCLTVPCQAAHLSTIPLRHCTLLHLTFTYRDETIPYYTVTALYSTLPLRDYTYYTIPLRYRTLLHLTFTPRYSTILYLYITPLNHTITSRHFTRLYHYKTLLHHTLPLQNCTPLNFTIACKLIIIRNILPSKFSFT